MPVIDTLKQIHIIHSIDICNVPVDHNVFLESILDFTLYNIVHCFLTFRKSFSQSKASDFLGFVKKNLKSKAFIQSHINAVYNISQDKTCMVLV